MNIFHKLLFGVATLPVCLYAQEKGDTVLAETELNEVVVTANSPALRQESDRLIYLIKNDPYALGLNGLQVLDRMPRVTVNNDKVSVAGKGAVKYIVDGHLLEMPDDAIVLKLKNLQSSGIDKIELLTTPPAKYNAGSNIAYISITTRNESLGTRGNIWGTGTIREDISYLTGGNISHTTRKVELSADACWQDTKGINDLTGEYVFPTSVQISKRSTRFNLRMLGVNGLFKYKFSNKLSTGAIANFSMVRMSSDLWDKTTGSNINMTSYAHSPSRPDNALTFTMFGDWSIDSKGKMLSLTYNNFARHTHYFSDITSAHTDSEEDRLTNSGANKYGIESLKLDASLPFSVFKVETGASYTAFSNRTNILLSNYISGEWITNQRQSNTFDYDEKTFAAYLSAEKSFGSSFFGKIAIRYEHTQTTGLQLIDNLYHNTTGNYLLPTINLSYRFPSAGRLAISYSAGLTRPYFNDLNPFRYYSTATDYFSGNPELIASTSHNAEINYSHRGLYAVIYTSFSHNAVGYVTRFNADDSRYTMPENCLKTNKTGLYASYNLSLFSRWNMKFGGEVFYSSASSRIEDFREGAEQGWSGKLEFNSSWMLNNRKNLILNFRLNHYFPWRDRMVRYSSVTLTGLDLRYALLDNRLNMTLTVNDPFGWNVTKSTANYKDFVLNSLNDVHSHAVTLSISWSLGRTKVLSPYRDTKERDSIRTR